MNSSGNKGTRRHPIGVVARRTGLKPDLIRAWERRYDAVQPERTQSRRRTYSEADIERLVLLHQAIRGGRSIGAIAGYSNDELQELIEGDRSGALAVFGDRSLPGTEVATMLTACLEAIESLDARQLERHFDRASLSLGRQGLIERLMVPLMDHVGALWRTGTLRPMHEHLASATLRSFVGGLRLSESDVEGAPHLLVTTPRRQVHELGALIAAAVAAAEGWRVTYMGPNLAAEEIAAAAQQTRSRAVALGINYPADDSQLATELEQLRRLLGPSVEILVGGRVVTSYQPTLDQIAARSIPDLPTLRQELERIRGALPS